MKSPPFEWLQLTAIASYQEIHIPTLINTIPFTNYFHCKCWARKLAHCLLCHSWDTREKNVLYLSNNNILPKILLANNIISTFSDSVKPQNSEIYIFHILLTQQWCSFVFITVFLPIRNGSDASINNLNGLFVKPGRMQIILNQGDQNAMDICVSYLVFAFCSVICAGMAPEALWVSKSVRIRNVLSNRALCANVPVDLQSAFAGDKAIVIERMEESSVCIIHTVVFNNDFFLLVFSSLIVWL